MSTLTSASLYVLHVGEAGQHHEHDQHDGPHAGIQADRFRANMFSQHTRILTTLTCLAARFHNGRAFHATRKSVLACLPPKINDSRRVTDIRLVDQGYVLETSPATAGASPETATAGAGGTSHSGGSTDGGDREPSALLQLGARHAPGTFTPG